MVAGEAHFSGAAQGDHEQHLDQHRHSARDCFSRDVPAEFALSSAVISIFLIEIFVRIFAHGQFRWRPVRALCDS
eukprot:128894-Rhodomonas_salina.2